MSYGPALHCGGHTLPRLLADGQQPAHTARVRTIALLLVAASFPALADEVDLSRGVARRRGDVPTLVVRAEGGNEFAPYGYVGGALSWLAGPHNSFEFGAGGGFPGLQLGFTARQLFGQDGQYLLAELSIAGNTRVNRGNPSPRLNVQAASADSSIWTCLGLGFEQRTWLFDFSAAADIVFTSADLTPHFSIHGGVGFGF